MSGHNCGYVKDDGEKCGTSFGLCECHGRCFVHAPCREEERSQARQKGAASTNAKKRGNGLAPHELPPLVDHKAAEDWTDAIGRAAATNRLSASAAQAALRAVREWRESRDAGQVSERLDNLMDALETWRETDDPSPVLELVEGGS